MMKPHTTPRTFMDKLSKGLLLSVGLATLNSPSLFASEETSRFTLAQNPASGLIDGTYLYGQSPQPEQIGKEYMVFKVQQGKVTGAVYLPQSEFSCFSGTLNAQQMRVSIVDPYDNSAYNHAIALENLSPVASGGNISQQAGLEGYHAIKTISDNDRRILQTCLDKAR